LSLVARSARITNVPKPTTIPASYTGATASYAGATNGWKVAEPQGQLPKSNWWEIFGDAELNELENQAAAANQQLKAASLASPKRAR